MVLDHGNALIFHRKFFLRITKDRLPDPSKICALELKAKFRRFGNPSVSTTIANDWSIFRFSDKLAFGAASGRRPRAFEGDADG
jgi:hypothetical protein